MRRHSAIIMRSKGAMLVPLPFDTPFSFLSQRIRRFLSYGSGHLAHLFILISVLNIKIKIGFVICAVTQKVIFPYWFILLPKRDFDLTS